MFFESNGVPRAVEVVDKKSYESDASKSARRPARDKADPLLPGSVAAPMAGEVIEVKVKPGASPPPGRLLTAPLQGLLVFNGNLPSFRFPTQWSVNFLGWEV